MNGPELDDDAANSPGWEDGLFGPDPPVRSSYSPRWKANFR